MISFKDMNDTFSGGHGFGRYFFVLGFITNLGQSLEQANEILSLILKVTSLASFGIFLLLNYPRIKVRVKQINRKQKTKRNAKE